MVRLVPPELIVCIALAAPAPASSQDSKVTPKSVKTLKFGQPDFSTLPMTDFDDTGAILIDWNVVEQTATSTVDPKRTGLAKLMLAIRDGKWKPMH